ncbi:MAG: nickel pincer cofactor biosynthesis protein LarB [Acidobacteriota bacterium]
MDKENLKKLLNEVAQGQMTPDDAVKKLADLPYEDIGFAKIDNHRALRDNFPEVVYCPGKTPVEIAAIVERIYKHGSSILATRAEREAWDAVSELVPEAHYNERARLIFWKSNSAEPKGQVAVVTAGTADIPVAEEAALCLEVMGAEVIRVTDVGVAGIHRVLDKVGVLNDAQVVIVVAGMEGALASVVGGLTKRPVIAVPTSVGYGANFGGLSALLSMLNTCAAGVGVVNIDNGYGAAALALAILNSAKD